MVKMVKIKIVDSTLINQNNLINLPDNILKVYSKIGFNGINLFSSHNIPFQLKKLHKNPFSVLKNLISIFNKTDLFTTVVSPILIQKKIISKEIIQKYLTILSELGINSLIIYDQLNDFNILDTTLKIAAKEDLNFKNIFAGIFLRPDLEIDQQKNLDLIRSFNNYGLQGLSLIEPLGLIKPDKMNFLFDVIKEFDGKVKSLHVKSSNQKLPIIISNAIKNGINQLEISSFAEFNHNTYPNFKLISELEFETKISLEKYDKFNEYIHDKYPTFRVFSDFKLALSNNVSKGVDIESIKILVEMKKNLNIKISINKIITELLQVKKDLGNPPLVSHFRDIMIAQTLFNIIDKDQYKTVPLDTKLYLSSLWGESPTSVNNDVIEKINSNFSINVRKIDITNFKINEQRMLGLSKLSSSQNDRLMNLNYIFAPEETENYNHAKNLMLKDLDFSNRENIARFVNTLLIKDNLNSNFQIEKPQNESNKSNNWRHYGRIMQMGRY